METSVSLTFILNWVLPAVILLVVTGISAYFIKKQVVDTNPDKTREIPRLLKEIVPTERDKSFSKTPFDGTNAGFIHRVVAFWIDLTLFKIPVDVITTIWITEAHQTEMMKTFSYITFVIYKIYLETMYGQTLGKYVMGIKVESTRSIFMIIQIIKRNIFYIVPFMLAFFGMIKLFHNYKFPAEWNPNVETTLISIWLLFVLDTLWYFVKNRGQTMHDIFGSTIVVKQSEKHKSFWWILIGLIILNNIVINLDNWM